MLKSAGCLAGQDIWSTRNLHERQGNGKFFVTRAVLKEFRFFMFLEVAEIEI